MGNVRKLDINGMYNRADGGGDVNSLLFGQWEQMLYADECIVMAREAIDSAGIEEISSFEYSSQQNKLDKEKNKLNKLGFYAAYDLKNELYDQADKDFAIDIQNKALETLSNIKMDEITIKNDFGVTITDNYTESSGIVWSPTYTPDDVSLKDFFGYKNMDISDPTYVKGFTDVLYAPFLGGTESIEEYLEVHADDMHELIHHVEFDNKKHQPGLQFVSGVVDAVSLGLVPLIKATIGYDFITDEELTSTECILLAVTGGVSLAGVGAVASAAENLTARELISLAVTEGLQEAASSGTMFALEDVDAPESLKLVLALIAGASVEAGGIKLINSLGKRSVVKAAVGAEDLLDTGGVVKGGLDFPSAIAKSWQGSGKYPGIDDYSDVVVKKGTILYRGEPNGTEYFTTLEAIEQSGRDSTKIFEGLQVEKHPIHGYRTEMEGYIFNEDLASAYGITKANPQFGRGGLPQYFVPNVEEYIEKGILQPVESIKLH